ncbi:MAG: SIMPL domain-containing protein [Salinibacter sp.]
MCVSSRRLGRLLPALLLLATPLQAQDQDAPQRTVRVSGEGTVTASPDQATVRFGIVTRAEAPDSARSQNAEASESVLNTVRDLGVPEDDIRMQSLRLGPRREYNRETRSQEEKGYEAARQVVVELDRLELLPRLVAQVVQRGANRLEGIDYDLSDRTAVRNDALRQAAENAREKAQLLAETLDARLGAVQEINEQQYSFDRPTSRVQMEFAQATQSDAEGEPDAFAAGEIEVSADVQVVYVLVTP